MSSLKNLFFAAAAIVSVFIATGDPVNAQVGYGYNPYYGNQNFYGGASMAMARTEEVTAFAISATT